MTRSLLPMDTLRSVFGEALQEKVKMSGYTTSRVGGPADALIIARSAAELENAAQQLWDLSLPFHLFGTASNVLVSDLGIRGVVVLNRANGILVNEEEGSLSVWAESGAALTAAARQAGQRSLSGMEWAATIPGTVGGAVYGNAGAHGGDTAHSLLVAEILQPAGKKMWSSADMQYEYRSSILKRTRTQAVILGARFALVHGDPQAIQQQMENNMARRKATQPPGASMGSMFKNPPGDHAGRLLEAAGMKGTRIGGAEISPMHANFFINNQSASANDIRQLIDLAQKTVYEKFHVSLELEIELVGEW